MKQSSYDVLVVGGGHAGCEAAMAAHRMGARTALVTFCADRIGEMSCNPAIGGLGKGQIVREIDALDGVMGRVADRAGIQFRLLNRSKGPAAQGPRLQADRKLYRESMQGEFRRCPDLDVLEGEVVDLLVQGTSLSGVRLAGGALLEARTVVLTTGTFLRGIIHLGNIRTEAGRMGDPAAVRLAERIEDLGLDLGRLKTGTPPRLLKASIDWDALEQQPGDAEPVMLSFLSGDPTARQVSCAITSTNMATHDIIRANLSKSAVYGGQIAGPGPRYCPSIEDKVVRFAEKTSHLVFLEPEGLDDPLVYPNGVSTSLPPDIQSDFLRTIPGLAHIEIARPGYAIEYDYVDPRGLDETLKVRALDGLYLAGQINGTTGYEEAAGQGLVAGLNAAAFALEREPAIFDRTTSFLGVMIDDLISRGVTEPYRMFTSRAEFRLFLRADNADHRLTPFGMRLGCVSAERAETFTKKAEAIEAGRGIAAALQFTPHQARDLGVEVKETAPRRILLDLFTFPQLDLGRIRTAIPELAAVSPEILQQVRNDALYAPYLSRQSREADALRRDAEVVLAEDLDYSALPGLSSELRAKLSQIRPRDLRQASGIEGMTPAALTLLLMQMRKRQKLRA